VIASACSASRQWEQGREIISGDGLRMADLKTARSSNMNGRIPVNIARIAVARKKSFFI